MSRQTVNAIESTKQCPNCGSTALTLIGTQNLKMCADCPTDIVWLMTPGQSAVHGGTVTANKLAKLTKPS